MSLVKIKKNQAYHSRFQVKWRRRREGKTDYFSRKRLICHDKRNHNVPKFRLVVRLTKKNVICQFVQSKLEGDYVLDATLSQELKFFGILFSLTSFPSAYLTGFLLAKKILKKKGLGFSEKSFSKSIYAILDIGLGRVTTGNKVFAIMKGAIDGGINIPHNEKRFHIQNTEKDTSSPSVNERIQGNHIMQYMKYIKEEDEELYSQQFRAALRNGIGPDDFLNVFLGGFDAIRKRSL